MKYSYSYTVLSFACIAFLCSCSNPSSDSRPNIVLINVDDMGWRDTGFMGSQFYETPNMDKLSEMGMAFSNGYASASNCAPSRASMMTGKWTPRHEMYTVSSSERGKSEYRKLIPTQNTMTLSKEHTVFPALLNQAGYSTCHAGKWHLSTDPLEYGFDVNIGGGNNGYPGSYYPPYKNVEIDSGENSYLTDLVMENLLQFLDTVSGPFFINYAPYAVHTPIQPVESLLPKYKNKSGSNGQNNAQYATMVDNLDRNIGLLMTHLKESGQINNTMIIFTSDNGGLYGITEQPPLRAGKGSYYEGGIRVPFVFVWNEKIAEGKRSDVPISNLDLFPTILEATGIEYSQNEIDGKNILPVLQEEVSDLDRQMFWHFPVYLQAYNPSYNENRDSLFRTRPGTVMRHGKWKLHYYFEDNEVELYDLEKDIHEDNNLASTEREQTEIMLKSLRNWWDQTNAPIPKTLNPEFLEVDK